MVLSIYYIDFIYKNIKYINILIMKILNIFFKFIYNNYGQYIYIFYEVLKKNTNFDLIFNLIFLYI